VAFRKLKACDSNLRDGLQCLNPEVTEDKNLT